MRMTPSSSARENVAMKKALISGALCFAGLVSGPAGAVTIDFSDFAVGTRLDGPVTIGAATFSSTSGTLLVTNFGAGNTICAAVGTSCTGTLVLEFAPGVSDFRMTYSGDDVPGSSILFQGQTTALSFVGRSFADGNAATADAISIRFPELTLLGLSSDDPDGVGFGGFSFNVPGVPEPASWAMMIAGVGVAGGALRRRRPVKTTLSVA
jgi:hypothetical protein